MSANSRTCLILCALVLSVHSVLAQPPADRTFVNQRTFGMPFTLAPADRANITAMKLYIRSEPGGEWQLHATASPAETTYDAAHQTQVGNFPVRIDRDGTYSFAIMTVFRDGRSLPPSVDQLRADKTVTVDTRPPQIMLEALPSKPTAEGSVAVGVKWNVTDEALANGGVRLEGRWYRDVKWVNFNRGGPAEESGQQQWTIQSHQRLEVRVTATDRAGNQATRTVVLGANVGTVTGGTGTVPPPAATPQPSFRLVKDRTISLVYRVRERPPSGIKQIDLYVTRLGNDWKKHEQSYAPPNDGSDMAQIDFVAPEDGTYGLTMVATSNAGQSQPPPKSNDPPQVWVEVDTKAPVAEFKSVRLSNPNDARTIVLEWKAEDKNIETLPILFEYAEIDPASGQPTKWTELAQPLPNSGRYVCPSPALSERAYQFLVRMTVYDKAGNSTVIQYKSPISLDVVKPQVEITDVKPATKATNLPK